MEARPSTNFSRSRALESYNALIPTYESVNQANHVPAAPQAATFICKNRIRGHSDAPLLPGGDNDDDGWITVDMACFLLRVRRIPHFGGVHVDIFSHRST